MPRYNFNTISSRASTNNNSVVNRTYYDKDGKVRHTYSYSNNNGYSKNVVKNGGLSWSFDLGFGAITRYLFIFSLVMIILSLIFKGVFDPKFQELFVTDIYYTSNGYELPISYLNYDWQFKINQLNGFKPIINVDLWKDLLTNNIFTELPFIGGIASVFNIIIVPLTILEAIITDFILAVGFIVIW